MVLHECYVGCEGCLGPGTESQQTTAGTHTHKGFSRSSLYSLLGTPFRDSGHCFSARQWCDAFPYGLLSCHVNQNLLWLWWEIKVTIRSASEQYISLCTSWRSDKRPVIRSKIARKSSIRVPFSAPRMLPESSAMMTAQQLISGLALSKDACSGISPKISDLGITEDKVPSTPSKPRLTCHTRKVDFALDRPLIRAQWTGLCSSLQLLHKRSMLH